MRVKVLQTMNWSDISLIVGCIVLSFVLFLAYCGAFHVITFRTAQPYERDLHVAYFHTRGPYKDCGPLFSKVLKIFGGKSPMFALYHDNPREVAADQCRYAVGVLLPNELSNETTAVLKSNGLCQHTLPTIEKAFMTDFPATSFLSCFFMVIKVYGNMEYHMKEANIGTDFGKAPFIELHNHVPGHVRVFMPLEKQERFVLPEFSAT
ncbi:testis-expressed protein 264 homolog [Corticium candelabrum]|uniref:testis-expressed protein 264 homolog n=1 Tax=Corticium candelabrum TaxID=121492 RepID=UPI002E25C2A6|nr:testis-expressed protein 264 homolog [Corticium candelabrum]